MTVELADDRALLGLFAAGWLGLFESLADLARLAPGPGEAVDVARWSARYVEAAAQLVDGLDDGKGLELMAPAQRALSEFSGHVPPRTWGEAALKCHLMLGAGQDLVRLTGTSWAPMVRSAAQGAPQHELAGSLADIVREGQRDDESSARLALFGRRVVAEGTAQAHRIASRQPTVAAGLLGAEGGSLDELSGTTQLIADLVEGAAQRMLDLHLQP